MSQSHRAPHAFSQGMLYAAIGSALSLPVAAQTASPEVQQLPSLQVQGQAPIDGYQANKISSEKFTAPLLDTPRTVIVIPEEVIKDRGATSLQDVLRTTPGVTLGSGEGGTPAGDRPFIRGYEASTDIFVDGLRDYGRGSHETFNLEAVEVIKGPSSAYTGRGGTGGSVNLSTKQPHLENFFEGSAGVGTEGQYRLAADGNIQLTDHAAFRLNLMRMGGDVPGRNDVKYDRYGIAPTLGLGLGTSTRLILSYSHIVNKDTPDWGMPFSNAANPDRKTPLEPDRDNYYGRNGIDYRKNQFDTVTADIQRDINDTLTARNVTRWSRSYQEYLYTRPSFDNCSGASPSSACVNENTELQFTRANRARWRESKALINQTELSGTFNTGALKHTFITGIEFSKEDVYSRSTLPGQGGPTVTGTDSFWNPNPNANFGSRNLAFGDKFKDGSINTKSIYLFDTIDFTPQWQVNLGLRWDDFRVHNAQNGDRRSDKMWNYQAGVVYKPAQNGAIYLSYGTSSNPAGENFGQAGGADGPAGGAQLHDLKPEKSQTWELGTKWDVFDEKLSLTAAIFQTEKTDARSTDPLTGNVSLSGSNRVRGLDLGAAGAITPNWNVWAGYSYLDPKIKTYRSGANIFDGNQIKFVAKHSATLWSTYKFLPQWTVGGGVTYVGKRFVDDANNLYLPSSTVFDAMLRYDVNKQISLQLNANNLSNERVYDASHVGIFANVGPGRSFMLTGTYRYE
ncbi:TonB-dependent siderophore receptor [Pusillimonas sp. CC-YST705]|uniref:TonB-dependent siderophore receptor n=1 Tax=Mesopusillimonas faecipullorum TaxID=2755040 RepID=A0ABS8CE12_9BURK|nr:TonB-dependent siderophore receptor [Mesopusillimonas faecipullorum]MCB5363819.1 TonB-dependent siderophore receptor [Mesopusillimonas faecipullorum]